MNNLHSIKRSQFCLFFLKNIDEASLEQAAIESIGSLDLDYKDDGYIELILKITALMCDGQYTHLQVFF